MKGVDKSAPGAEAPVPGEPGWEAEGTRKASKKGKERATPEPEEGSEKEDDDDDDDDAAWLARRQKANAGGDDEVDQVVSYTGSAQADDRKQHLLLTRRKVSFSQLDDCSCETWHLSPLPKTCQNTLVASDPS